MPAVETDRIRLFEFIEEKLEEQGYNLFRIIPPSFTIMEAPETFGVFEIAARTCYKSEDKIDEGTDELLLNKMLRLDHMAMTEFLPDMTVRFKTDRGTSHEMVRMRHCSFAQESQRYVRYNKKIDFVIPWTITPESLLSCLYDRTVVHRRCALFLDSCIGTSANYMARIENGERPEEARGVLTNETATTICVKANMREWFHIFNLRADSPAHPNYRLLASNLYSVCKDVNPFIFNTELDVKLDIAQDVEWGADNFDMFKDRNTYTIIPS